MIQKNNIWGIEVCIVRSYKDHKYTVKWSFIGSLIVSEHSANIKKVMISSTGIIFHDYVVEKIFFFFYFMNLWWISKILLILIQQLYVLLTNAGNTVVWVYHLKFFLLLSPFLSQTQAPEEAVSAGLQISLEGVLNCRLQGVQWGKPSSLLLVVCIGPVRLF